MDNWDQIARGVALSIFGGAVSWLAWMSRITRDGPQTGPFGLLRSKLSGESGTMRCKQSVRLTPQHSLHLVELGRQRFLLACHPGGATLLPGEICKEAHGESGIAA
jgi:hypothetical protein